MSGLSDDYRDALEELTRLRRVEEALAEVVKQFDLWSEDANDGTYAYYRSDGLMVACVAARAALATPAAEE